MFLVFKRLSHRLSLALLFLLFSQKGWAESHVHHNHDHSHGDSSLKFFHDREKEPELFDRIVLKEGRLEIVIYIYDEKDPESRRFAYKALFRCDDQRLMKLDRSIPAEDIDGAEIPAPKYCEPGEPQIMDGPGQSASRWLLLPGRLYDEDRMGCAEDFDDSETYSIDELLQYCEN